MDKLIILTIVFLNLGDVVAQSKQPISFTCVYAKSNDSDNIKLAVKNLLTDKTFYYAISVAGLADTGWVVLNSDIKSIGQNVSR